MQERLFHKVKRVVRKIQASTTGSSLSNALAGLDPVNVPATINAISGFLGMLLCSFVHAILDGAVRKRQVETEKGQETGDKEDVSLVKPKYAFDLSCRNVQHAAGAPFIVNLGVRFPAVPCQQRG
jgi:hypothetical protein